MSNIPELRRKPGHLLWRAQQLGWQYFAEEVRDANITPVQEVVLFALRRSPNTDLKTLATLVALDRSTTGDVVARLEQRGFIDRMPDKKDRRAWSLSLTPAGEKFSDGLATITKRAVTRFMSAISANEQEELMRILRKLVGLADALDQQNTPLVTTERLVGKSVLVIGSGKQSEYLSNGFETQGATTTTISFEATQGEADIVREFKRIKKSHYPSAVVVTADDLEALQPNFNDYEEIHRRLAFRAGLFRSACKVLVNTEMLRIINLGLFLDEERGHVSNDGSVAVNRSIAAITEEFYPSCHELGASLSSLTPRVTVIAQHQSREIIRRSARVSELDIAACACFLVSNDARSLAEINISLGVPPVRKT